MTSFTTAPALLPIIIGGNIPGHEIEHPMAVIIIVGLATSLVLNLLCMPVLYWKFGKSGR
jgi:multidrug efflux pump subunit AcrB